MKFEFDPEKSAANRTKHGIDFQRAQELWSDPKLLEIAVRTSDEPRFLVIGRMKRKHWAAIITYRETRIRIISVRRARKEEVRLYESDEY